jgi:hypothetical protein
MYNFLYSFVKVLSAYDQFAKAEMTLHFFSTFVAANHLDPASAERELISAQQ